MRFGLKGVIGIPVLIGAIWAGFPSFTLLIGVSALCGLWEFYKLTTSIGVRVFAPLGILWTVLFVANGQLTAQEGNFTLFLIGGLLLTTFVSASIHSLMASSVMGGSPSSPPASICQSCFQVSFQNPWVKTNWWLSGHFTPCPGNSKLCGT